MCLGLFDGGRQDLLMPVCGDHGGLCAVGAAAVVLNRKGPRRTDTVLVCFRFHCCAGACALPQELQTRLLRFAL